MKKISAAILSKNNCNFKSGVQTPQQRNDGGGVGGGGGDGAVRNKNQTFEMKQLADPIAKMKATLQERKCKLIITQYQFRNPII